MMHFIRVRAGLVIEIGRTDAGALADMQAASVEYRIITAEQAGTLKLGDPAP